MGCLSGIDGSVKMLKLFGNILFFFVSEEIIYCVVSVMYIDFNYLKISDLGKIEGNVVFMWLDVFYLDKIKVVVMKVYY